MPSQWSLRRIAAAGFVLLGVVFVGFILFKTFSVILSIFIGILVGWGLKRPVGFLEGRHIPHGLALVGVILALLALIPIAVFLVVPLVSDSLTQVWDSLQAAAQQLASRIPPSLRGTGATPAASAATATSLQAQIQKFIQDHASAIAGGVVEVGASVISLVFSLITILLIAVLWMSEEAAIRRYALSYLPEARRPTAETLWLDMEQQLGGYVRGLVVLMFVVGIGCGLGYLVLGVPSAAALGVLMFFLEFIPIPGVGSAIASVVVGIVAFADSPTKGILAVAWTIIVFETANSILFPRVMGRALGISSLGVLVALLIFVALLGPIGALVAVPLAGALGLILEVVRTGTVPTLLPQGAAAGAPPTAPIPPGAG